MQKEQKDGVIYQINCKECDREHIGEAGRQLEARKNEHHADVRYKRIERSALAEHSAITGHKIDWENVKIIEKEEDW